jgi:hypothetical protein
VSASHLPCAEQRVIFAIRFLRQQALNQVFFYKRREGLTETWFSLEQKLDDFTSIFRTTYADTGGGCEEIVPVGGGIGTGAGAGVELNKKGAADEAADNNGWAGRAAEGK